jgi:phthiodiolone/phenolphthiodiolone dimycocerosates ketoreductase
METPSLTTACFYYGFRHAPAKAVVPFAQGLEQAGVDHMWMFDFLTGFLPRAAWTKEFSPAAEILPDSDSFYDPYVVMGMAAAGTTRLGLAMLATNACRQGPAEVMRMALTLADATNGKAIVGVGTGERIQTEPFGYRRSEGIARLEDHFRLYRLLQDCDGPFSFEGNVWRYDNAYIGTTRRHQPKMWAVGAGPRLLDIAARYADGWLTWAPGGFPDAEVYARQAREMKQRLERYGRDPECFDFGLQAGVMLHDDPDVIENMFEHSDFLAYFSALYGRFNHGAWKQEGVPPVFPNDWNYSLRFLPNEVTRGQFEATVKQVPRAMKERSLFSGAPKEAATHLRGYVDAGVTWVGLLDFLPFVLGLAEAPASLERTAVALSLLKQ